MTPDDITQIERELRMALPAEYRAVVTDYPQHLPPVARGYDLLDHPAIVISENRNAREGAVYDTHWPEYYFIIGHDGSGGWFCLDTRLDHSPIIYFDHEDRSFREVATSLREWLPQILELYAE